MDSINMKTTGSVMTGVQQLLLKVTNKNNSCRTVNFHRATGCRQEPEV